MKQSIFSAFSQELRPDTILATNTSSISITKIAASAVPKGISPSSEQGKKNAGRVVGKPSPLLFIILTLNWVGLHFFNPVPVMVCHDIGSDFGFLTELL